MPRGRIRKDARSLVLVAGVLLAAAAPAAASPTQETILMDDPKIVYGSEADVESAFTAIKSLGVDRVRVSVYWRLIAPSPESKQRPAFVAEDPGAYPPESWERYDRIVRVAERHGLALLFSVTGPPPLWATGTPERTSIEETYTPHAGEFQAFVYAVGQRYPRVDAWSIWNEPNHPGWLTPQWLGGQRAFPVAPHLYRVLVDSAWAGLLASGHGDDLVLLGETAPRGWAGTSVISALRPLEFVRELYCFDRDRRPFTGGAAAARGCPPTLEARRGFVEAHPGLFRATGWAHHAYGFAGPPSTTSAPHPDDVQLADLARLTRTLDAILRRYGQPQRFHVWVTEYGYQTNPPDPYGGVSWSRQAAYLNEAEYLTYRDPRVASMAQFLLYDDLPWTRYPPGDKRYWATFQTGLLLSDGTPKPSFYAFHLPIHVAPARQRRGGRFRVFGQLRAAGRDQPLTARVEFAAGGARASSRPVATLTTRNPRGFVNVTVPARASGTYRIVWTDPQTGREVATRPVRVRVER